MTQAEFLEKQATAHAEWIRILASIPRERMLEVVAGEWTVKDVIAHVTWGEREMAGVRETRALIGSELWNVPQQERNTTVWKQNRDRSLEDVLSDAETVYRKLEQELRKVSDEELKEARYFREMPAEWKPWEVIASNTFEHYPEHVAMLRAWLDKI